ncbi:hypothetical protein ADENT20671_0096 [Actinomyces denticolens]|nr:hypothetical protein ADENT20671_0096 [Actinomyces denticolens]
MAGGSALAEDFAVHRAGLGGDLVPAGVLALRRARDRVAAHGRGLVYTVGAIVYARKRPDPLPRWFGFHEVFHTCTVAAWACHAVACYIAILS